MTSRDQPLPRPPRKWARAKQSGAHGLRRGAWYAVVNDSRKMVVLEVRKENVPVPREMVELSDVAPTKWSVVEWSKGQLGVRRASESNMGMSYAVCPACRERRAVEPANAQSMVCPGCGATFEVDWENPC